MGNSFGALEYLRQQRAVLMDCSAYFWAARSCLSDVTGVEGKRPTVIANLNKEQSQVNVISGRNMILINYMFKRACVYRHVRHKIDSRAGTCRSRSRDRGLQREFHCSVLGIM
jgi:hypothetical protein